MLGPSGAFIPALSYLPPSANCGSIALSLCGIRVPDSLRGDNWPLQQQQELSAVLGYMLLLLDLMASYLGSPLLHEGSYQVGWWWGKKHNTYVNPWCQWKDEIGILPWS
jgi:hypothetical protein